MLTSSARGANVATIAAASSFARIGNVTTTIKGRIADCLPLHRTRRSHAARSSNEAPYDATRAIRQVSLTTQRCHHSATTPLRRVSPMSLPQYFTRPISADRRTVPHNAGASIADPGKRRRPRDEPHRAIHRRPSRSRPIIASPPAAQLCRRGRAQPTPGAYRRSPTRPQSPAVVAQLRLPRSSVRVREQLQHQR